MTLGIIQNTQGSLYSSCSRKLGYFSLAAYSTVEKARIWVYLRSSRKYFLPFSQLDS